MAKNKHQDWAEQQIAGLVAAGIDLSVAQATVKRILDRLPEGENPATYAPADVESFAEVTPADIAQARANWYASDVVPPKYKRLLDAVRDESNA